MPVHKLIRLFNTRDTYPEQNLSNDLSQGVVARRTTVFLRGQVAQDLVCFFDHVNEEGRFVVEGIFNGADGTLAKAGPLSFLEREIHDFQKYLVIRLCPEKTGAAKVAAE